MNGVLSSRAHELGKEAKQPKVERLSILQEDGPEEGRQGLNDEGAQGRYAQVRQEDRRQEVDLDAQALRGRTQVEDHRDLGRGRGGAQAHRAEEEDRRA